MAVEPNETRPKKPHETNAKWEKLLEEFGRKAAAFDHRDTQGWKELAAELETYSQLLGPDREASAEEALDPSFLEGLGASDGRRELLETLRHLVQQVFQKAWQERAGQGGNLPELMTSLRQAFQMMVEVEQWAFTLEQKALDLSADRRERLREGIARRRSRQIEEDLRAFQTLDEDAILAWIVLRHPEHAEAVGAALSKSKGDSLSGQEKAIYRRLREEFRAELEEIRQQSQRTDGLPEPPPAEVLRLLGKILQELRHGDWWERLDSSSRGQNRKRPPRDEGESSASTPSLRPRDKPLSKARLQRLAASRKQLVARSRQLLRQVSFGTLLATAAAATGVGLRVGQLGSLDGWWIAWLIFVMGGSLAATSDVQGVLNFTHRRFSGPRLVQGDLAPWEERRDQVLRACGAWALGSVMILVTVWTAPTAASTWWFLPVSLVLVLALTQLA